MDEKEEREYSDGSRAAWGAMFRECLRNLGYEDLEAGKAGWVIEREATILALRSVCDEFGDNAWEDRLNLADVVEKHLARHLRQ